MSSPIRLYHKLHKTLSQWGKWGRPELLQTLALLMTGIFESRDVRTGRIASKVPLDIQEDSVAQRFRRWLKSPRVEERAIFDPVARRLLWGLHLVRPVGLRHTRLRIQVDRTLIQDRFNVLMVSVYYRKRAIPLVWRVLPHMGNSRFMEQVEILSHLHDLLPANATVVLLGDREFGTADMMRTIRCYGWDYALRVKGSPYIYLIDTHQWVKLRTIAPQPGTSLYLTDVLLTQSNTYGPIHFALACAPDSDDPWFIATNRIPTQRVLRDYPTGVSLWDYARRFACEEMFSDFKARGFDLERSQLQHRDRFSRLLLVAALLYVWIITLARGVRLAGLLHSLTYRVLDHRYSMFQIGYRWFSKQLSLGKPLVPSPAFHEWSLV